MESLEDLKILMRAIEDARKCAIHGSEKLEVCVECGSVLCMGCQSKGCQCWNDD